MTVEFHSGERASNFPRLHKMKFRWWLWSIVTTLLAAYIAAGYLASRTDIISIKLEPGFSTETRVFRWALHDLRIRLRFSGDHLKRPELGDNWGSVRSGDMQEVANPGAAIRITASAPETPPITFEAMPKNAFGSGTVFRDLTSNLSIRPGVWRSPPPADTPKVMLHPGLTPITITVASVDRPLVGETVSLMIDPPLGFKASAPNVAWLWFWFFWPIMAATQLLWAVVLIVIARRER